MITPSAMTAQDQHDAEFDRLDSPEARGGPLAIIPIQCTSIVGTRQPEVLRTLGEAVG
jgi:hypothetical protein